MYTSGVYWICNNINGCIYIGSSCHVYNRFRTHTRRLEIGSHGNPYLQNAWNKYRHINFIFEVLLICEKHELLIYEQCLIDLWNPEYNLCLIAGAGTGGPHFKGKKHSIEVRLLMSEDRIGNQYAKGAIRTEEFKQMISNIMIGNNHQNWRGRQHTNDTKRKMSTSQKGNKNGIGNKSRTGQKFSADQKRKMSEAAKKSWAKRKLASLPAHIID